MSVSTDSAAPCMRIDELACSNIAVLAPIPCIVNRVEDDASHGVTTPVHRFVHPREAPGSSENDDSAVNQASWRAHGDKRVSHLAKIKSPTRTIARSFHLFVFARRAKFIPTIPSRHIICTRRTRTVDRSGGSRQLSKRRHATPKTEISARISEILALVSEKRALVQICSRVNFATV